MLITQYLTWLQTAEDGPRADSARVLARVWLQSPLDAAQREEVRAALILLLDDPCAAVRQGLGETFAASDRTPRAVLFGLLQAEDEAALPLLRQSPLLGDGDLIVALGEDSTERQVAIASRAELSPALSAAIAEIAGPEACAALLDNAGARLVPGTLRRLASRFGGVASVRERLLARADLTVTHRYDLLVLRLLEQVAGCLSPADETKGDGLVSRLPAGVEEETSDRVALQVAEAASDSDLESLIEHLRRNGRLTTRLLLRALCCGRMRLVTRMLSRLTDLPVERVERVLGGEGGAQLRALLRKAGVPVRAHQTFQLALWALKDLGGTPASDLALRRARELTETLTSELQDEALGENGDILGFLRSFALDVSRAEARAYLRQAVRAQIAAASAA